MTWRRPTNGNNGAGPHPRCRNRGLWRLEYLFALILVPVAVILSQNPGIIGAAPSLMQLSDGAAETTPSSSLLSSGIGCNIKGNISINTGERIYHVPGHYWETKISPSMASGGFAPRKRRARPAGARRVGKIRLSLGPVCNVD
jgi:hypothetical protein